MLKRVGGACTEGGGAAGDTLAATCRTPPLAAGSYTLVYGEQQLPFVVPGRLDRFCLWGNY